MICHMYYDLNGIAMFSMEIVEHLVSSPQGTEWLLLETLYNEPR